LAGTNVSGDGVAFFLEHISDYDRSTFFGEQPRFLARIPCAPPVMIATFSFSLMFFSLVDEHDPSVGCGCRTRD
jgi:hypothetical protein